jgi:hypothetical protein
MNWRIIQHRTIYFILDCFTVSTRKHGFITNRTVSSSWEMLVMRHSPLSVRAPTRRLKMRLSWPIPCLKLRRRKVNDSMSTRIPRDGFSEQFQRYYDQRLERTKHVVEMGNLLNKLYHSHNFFLKWALDLFLTSITRGGAMFKQLENEIV